VPSAAPPRSNKKDTLLTRPRSETVTVPQTMAWAPNTTRVAPAIQGLRIRASASWQAASVHRPAQHGGRANGGVQAAGHQRAEQPAGR
jgi:hypothetical protein